MPRRCCSTPGDHSTAEVSTKSVLGDADAPRFGDAFEPGCDVDPVAEDVVAFDQDITEMNANPPATTRSVVTSVVSRALSLTEGSSRSTGTGLQWDSLATISLLQ